MESSDYEETKEETMDQLKELNTSLLKLVNGDISLVNSIGALQLVSAKIKPHLLNMFICSD